MKPSRWLPRVRTLARARSGQVAIIFGLATLPILFAAGAAVDYGRRNAAKTRLDAALDGTILAVMSQQQGSAGFNTAWQNMETQFRAEAAKVPGVTIDSFTPGGVVIYSRTGLMNLSASYTANVKTTLGGLMKVPSLKISGTASGARNRAQYMNFYLLLDDSPSMGLAATDADQSNMKAAIGCAFACHEHAYDSRGNAIGDDPNDNYHYARRNNIKLRIDLLRDSVSALVDQANTSTQVAQQFQMEMWTFDQTSVQTRLQAMTPTLGDIKTAASKIDLAYGYHDHRDIQTDYESAFAKMNSVVPTGGTGLTSTNPIQFLFFVTDGVQDTNTDISNKDASVLWNPGQNRWVGPINPAICQSLKDKNVRIGVIYTKYLPIPTDGTWYNTVRIFQDKMEPALKACASEGLYFSVATGGDISTAMVKLFQSSLASVRLTN